jgi:hypothetical protein
MDVESEEEEFTQEDYKLLLARCREQDAELIRLKKSHSDEIERLTAEISKLKKENRKLLKKVNLFYIKL